MNMHSMLGEILKVSAEIDHVHIYKIDIDHLLHDKMNGNILKIYLLYSINKFEWMSQR